jgi:hypothetical protein
MTDLPDIGEYLHEFWIESTKLADAAKEASEHFASGDAQSACNAVALTHYRLDSLPTLLAGLLRDFAAQGVEPGLKS